MRAAGSTRSSACVNPLRIAVAERGAKQVALQLVVGEVTQLLAGAQPRPGECFKQEFLFAARASDVELLFDQHDGAARIDRHAHLPRAAGFRELGLVFGSNNRKPQCRPRLAGRAFARRPTISASSSSKSRGGGGSTGP